MAKASLIVIVAKVYWCGVVEQELSKQPFGGNICDMSSSLCSFSSPEIYFVLGISVVIARDSLGYH